MSIRRRNFLGGVGAGLAGGLQWPRSVLSGGLSGFDSEADVPVAFLMISDTHVLADAADPSQLDARCVAVTSRFVDRLNVLAGTEIPESAGGGKVRELRGVIHGGDCIDTGDKPRVEMQRTEWAGFEDFYGLTGRDGRLQLPLYEVHGNHDSPRGDGYAVQRIRARNSDRLGLSAVSENGLHYSWDWGPVHFVNLGIVVGEVSEPARRRRYAPLGSLQFLQEDLQKCVGSSNRPIVLTHHIDVLRYSQSLPVETAKAEGMEWDPADVRAYYEALRGYRVAGVLYGHTHGRNIFRWDGTSKAAKSGIPTFNCDNSSHFGGVQQAILYFEIWPDRVLVREYGTKDAWETASWTPQVWEFSGQ